MVRTSTESQSTEAQREELVQFCKEEGYDDIVCVERQGASAAKVDEEYRQMIEEVKSKILQDPDIKCFAVWHLNRLSRTEEVWVELKSFFVKHQVQIICKNPYLRLLTPDGKVDPGMELAMGLMAILAKQDNEERKEKFKRAKVAMMKQGKCIGGKNLVRYGYKIGDARFFVVNEEEAEVVRLIYQLYSTGEYSSYTLGQELRSRGIEMSDYKISRILRTEAYIGGEVGKYGLHYPPIVSKEVWDKCQAVRNENKIESMKRGERLVLGAKLVRCSECGGICSSNSHKFVCSRSAHHGPCGNKHSLRQDVVDELLWRVAYAEHFEFLMNMQENKAAGLWEELLVIEEKIDAAERKAEDLKAKKDRIVDTFLEGLIDRENRDRRLLKLKDDTQVQEDAIRLLWGRKNAILGLLNSAKKDTLKSFEAALDTMDTEDKYKVIHQHIESLTFRPESFGKRDPRTKWDNGVRITITTLQNKEHTFMYVPCKYEGSNLYVFNGKDWVKDRLDLKKVK